MQLLEHSLEMIVLFLNKKNSAVEIVPILIPYINYKTMNSISTDLSNVVQKILKTYNLNFREDIAKVISNNTVHSDTENWSKKLASCGVDRLGTKKPYNMTNVEYLPI
jgi:AmmeMemoRadiSam system protein B